MSPLHRIVAFWKARAKQTKIPVDEGDLFPLHLAYLSQNIRGCRDILDFGPGYGRLFAAYKDAGRIEGYDITGHWRDILKEKAKDLGIKFRLTVTDEIGQLPYAHHEFDAAVATEVFLHQTPADIRIVMSELARVAAKVVAMSFYIPSGEIGRLAGGNYHHDYPALCEELGLEILNRRQVRKQLFFTYRK